ncbi:MAG: phage holin family protein [Pseudoclavibacter sp.]|jgi:hypothetical protein
MSDRKSYFGAGTHRQSLGQVISDASADIQRLIAEHIELAKAELRQTGIRVAIGAGMFAAAAVLLGFAVFFLSLAAWWGLGLLIGNAWSGLALGGFWLVVALIAIGIGVGKFKKLTGIPRTAEAAKHTAQVLRTGKDA